MEGVQRTWIPLAKDEMLSYSVETDTLELSCLTEACERDRENMAGLLRLGNGEVASEKGELASEKGKEGADWDTVGADSDTGEIVKEEM